MKSVTIATALLASVAIAQPHGHFRRHNHHHRHEKRDLVVEWTTEWVTETVYVDDTATSTVAASTTAPAAQPTPSSKGVQAQFYEPHTKPQPPAPEVKPSTAAAEPVEPSPEPSPEPVTTSPPPPVVAPTTLIPAPAPSAPSVYVPPPPPPSPTVVAPPPPAQSPAQPASPPAPSYGGGSSGGSGGGEKFHGDMTYYTPGMGSCGYDDSSPKDNVVAVSKDWFMKIGNGKTSYGVDQPANILCDKTITISANGKTTTAVIRDSCPGCAPGAIDVTEGAFKDIFGSLDVGRSEVTWWLNEPVA